MVADIEEFENLDASELHARRLNAKEVLTPQNGEQFLFPIIDRNDEKNMKFFEENPTNSLLQPFFKMTQYGMMRKQELISGLLREISFTLRVKLHMRREESFPIPLKYIDVTRATHTSLGVLLEKLIDEYWNVDEDRELSDAWTGFTRFIKIERKAT